MSRPSTGKTTATIQSLGVLNPPPPCNRTTEPQHNTTQHKTRKQLSFLFFCCLFHRHRRLGAKHQTPTCLKMRQTKRQTECKHILKHIPRGFIPPHSHHVQLSLFCVCVCFLFLFSRFGRFWGCFLFFFLALCVGS